MSQYLSPSEPGVSVLPVQEVLIESLNFKLSQCYQYHQGNLRRNIAYPDQSTVMQCYYVPLIKCLFLYTNCIFLHGVKITTFGKGRRILVRISNEIADKDAIKKSFAGNPTHHY